MKALPENADVALSNRLVHQQCLACGHAWVDYDGQAAAKLYEESLEREARFRLTVVPAYNDTRALTGYRCVTVNAGSIVDAAHIHQFADSRNNHPQNGLALSNNAHWMFDVGLWSLADD
jgi:predicted restriction endonuclease